MCQGNAEGESMRRARATFRGLIALAVLGGMSGVAARPPSPTELEAKLISYLRHVDGESGLSKEQAVGQPTQADYFYLARYWNELSPEFHALYKTAATIPSTFDVYVSAGGGFEIYYTTTGGDAVDPADTYGFDSGDWRARVQGANGTPDYIDEIGWALDSSFGLEVDSLGFPSPYPHREPAYPSDRYKVIVEALEEGIYGLTQPVSRSSSSIGYTSLISIRNDWSGITTADYLDYENDPVSAARITCAHELFHAIQFSLARRHSRWRYGDDYPLSWSEGTAVLMEELAFGDINDHRQYADVLFTFRQIPAIDMSDVRGAAYLTGIFALYLYYFAAEEPGIDFVKTIYQNNYSSSVPFEDNLIQTSQSLGYEWKELLGRFHRGCYFTGEKFDRRYFMPDAELYPTWPDSLEYPEGFTYITVEKMIYPYAGAHWEFRYEPNHGDTLTVEIAATDDNWSATAIVTNNGAIEAIAPLSFSGGRAGAGFRGWRSGSEAMVLVSNPTAADTAREAGVTFAVPEQAATPGVPLVVHSPRDRVEAPVKVFDIRGRTAVRMRPGGASGVYVRGRGGMVKNGIVE